MTDIDPEILDYLKRANVYQLPTEKLVPNPWNPNEMGEVEWDALGQSIVKYGIHLQPLVVRPLGDRFQIIDGEHRFRWAEKLAIATIPAVIIDVPNVDAKKLTQVLNRTRGQDNPVKLHELLDGLLSECSAEEVIEGLPIADSHELEKLILELKDVTSSSPDSGQTAKDRSGKSGEIDTESFTFEHKCPRCGFEFDG